MKNMHKTQIAQSTNKDRKHKHFKDQNECGICAFGAPKAQIPHSLWSLKCLCFRSLFVLCAICVLCMFFIRCVLCFQTLICSRNSSKIHIVSIGPGAASGWNCTERHLLDLCRIPSFEPSFAFTNHSSHPTGRVFPFTA